jgi:uncharacterized membrane protein YccC
VIAFSQLSSALSWLKQRALLLISGVQTTTRSVLQGNRSDVWSGLRMALVVLVPLLTVGLLTRFPGFSDSANFLVLGALFTALMASSDGTYGMRACMMMSGACLLAFACFCGSLSGNLSLLALSVVLVWTFGAGLLAIFGRVGATLSYGITVCFVLPLANPTTLEHVWLRCALLLSGALWAIIILLCDWPFRRSQPFRSAISVYYEELQVLLSAVRSALAGSAAGERQSEDKTDLWILRTRVQNARKVAHQILPKQSYNTNPTIRRLSLFLENADALFDVQASLAVSLRAVSFQAYPPSVKETCIQGIAVAEQTLASLAEASRRGKLPDNQNDELTKALQEATKHLTVACSFPQEEDGDMLALAQLQHLCSLFRAFSLLCRQGLALIESPLPDQPIIQPKHEKGLHNALLAAWQTLARHLTSHSRILRYALRLSITVSLATALSFLLHIPHGYWLPMSVAILLKPDFATTRQRVRQRLGGTFAGGLLAGALSLALYEQGLLLVLMTLLCFLAFLTRPRNYGIYTFFLTTFLILSTDLGDPGNWTVALVRVASNLIGAMLVYFAVTLLWPLWEHEKLPTQMNKTMIAIRKFLQAVMSIYLVPIPEKSKINKARQLAMRECLTTTALVERLSREPQSNRANLARQRTLLASLQHLYENLAALALQTALPTGSYEPLPTLQLLVNQIAQALQECEDSMSYGQQAERIFAFEGSLLAVQSTLRALARQRLNEQTASLPNLSHQKLPGMYTLLNMHLPSLVRYTADLCRATYEE